MFGNLTKDEVRKLQRLIKQDMGVLRSKGCEGSSVVPEGTMYLERVDIDQDGDTRVVSALLNKDGVDVTLSYSLKGEGSNTGFGTYSTARVFDGGQDISGCIRHEGGAAYWELDA